MSSNGEHQTIPLSVLLKRELASEKVERPEICHGQAGQSKKGEDFTFHKTECQRVACDGVSTYSVFALFDGHNGSAAAIYSKEQLLSNILAAIPSDLNRDEWVAALPRAMVAGFVKTDKDLQERAKTSGTTAKFVIIEGWVVTVSSVGDSRCVLESAEGGLYYLSADHRLDCNVEERERITSSGGEVGRLNTGGGTEKKAENFGSAWSAGGAWADTAYNLERSRTLPHHLQKSMVKEYLSPCFVKNLQSWGLNKIKNISS